MFPECLNRRIGLGASLVLAGILVASNALQAQDTSEVKRKVKTRVAPEYPALARQMNVVGKVKIEVMISPEGVVKWTHVVGGSPLLVNAALGAVKKWRFEPASKETTEIIEFEFNPASQ